MAGYLLSQSGFQFFFIAAEYIFQVRYNNEDKKTQMTLFC